MRRPDVTLGQAACLLIALALDILIFVPFSPSFPREQLDSSWRYATNYGLAHDFQFGRDLIFTSGPLSFIYIHQYYPGLFVLMLTLSVFVITVLTVGIWTIARPSRRALILALPVLLAQAPDLDAAYLFMPLLLLWVACRAPERGAKAVVMALLTIACALLPLVKGSFALAVLSLCGMVLAADGPRHPRRTAGLVAVFVATLAAAWLACGQAPATFIGYVNSEAQIVSGYTDAMSLEGSAWEPLLFAAAAVAILIVGLYGLRHRAVISVAGLGTTLFFAFKAGFVRQDGHVLIATSAILMAGLLVTLAGAGRAANLALPLVIAAWCLVSRPYAPVDPSAASLRLVGAVKRSVDALRNLPGDRGGDRRSFEAALAGIRARTPLKDVSGSVDIYPTDIAVVLADGLDWRPRPIIQSYSAYTDRLATLNAESLAQAGAPGTILFKVATIDGRYPALDDGRSWPTLVARYRPVGRRGEYVVLKKRDRAAETAIGAPLVNRDVDLGEKVAIPTGPVWAEIDLDPTVPGRLVSAVYKLPLLTLTIDYANGNSRDFRFIASTAKAGFLLSPTVEKAATLLELQSPGTPFASTGAVPVSFSIEADDTTGRLWRRRFHAVLRPITFPATEGVDALLLSALKPLDGDLPSSFEGDCAVDAVAGQDGSDIRLDAAARLLNLSGWAMISAADARANQGLSVAFVPVGGGPVLAADLPKLASPGLAEHFGTPAAGNAAFDTDVDVRALPRGRYNLQLVQREDDGAVQCRHRAILVDRR